MKILDSIKAMAADLEILKAQIAPMPQGTAKGHIDGFDARLKAIESGAAAEVIRITGELATEKQSFTQEKAANLAYAQNLTALISAVTASYEAMTPEVNRLKDISPVAMVAAIQSGVSKTLAGVSVPIATVPVGKSTKLSEAPNSAVKVQSFDPKAPDYKSADARIAELQAAGTAKLVT